MTLNLYKISQTVNDDYDTFDAAIVAAESEQDARVMLPHFPGSGAIASQSTWAAPEFVDVEFIGVAGPDIYRGAILSSFNAG